MKLNRLDTHDRYEHFTKQGFDISECCQDMINKRPFGPYAFYIFAHSRTLGMDEKLKLFSSGKYINFSEVPDKTIIWQPRLTRPKPQSNSMLFKGYPGTDVIKIIWMIPDKALWGQYEKGFVTENTIVKESILTFKNNPQQLEQKEDDDLSDDQIDAIYRDISLGASQEKLKDKLYL